MTPARADTQAQLAAPQTLEEWKQHPEEYRQIVTVLQMMLGRFGYGTGPFNGILDDKTLNGLRAYQQYNGFPVTGELDTTTAAQLQADSESLDQVPVSLPKSFVATELWEQFVWAGGTWVMTNDKPYAPLQTSRIWCDRTRQVCSEATAMVTPDKLLMVDISTYTIERWDAYELITKPKDFRCVRETLRVGRVTQVVTRIRTPLATTGDCEGTEPKDQHLRLEDGFKVWWDLKQAERAAIQRVLRLKME